MNIHSCKPDVSYTGLYILGWDSSMWLSEFDSVSVPLGATVESVLSSAVATHEDGIATHPSRLTQPLRFDGPNKPTGAWRELLRK
jgi:hypothetical protein